MKCEEYTDELFAGWINNQLSSSDKEKLENHITQCPACLEELALMQRIWDDMGRIKSPEPPAELRIGFHSMLEDFKASAEGQTSLKGRVGQWFGRLWQLQPRWPLAYTLVLLVVFGLAYWFFQNVKGYGQDKQLQALAAQVGELKQTMTLALLENPSASERMRGVNYTTEMKNADKQVIDALLATLNNDPNVNVRLSTLDALTHLARYPEVRLGLIKSITQQESPLMQSAIADVMLKLQEKRAVSSFKQLLKQKNMDQGVREKINETIKSLI